MKPFENKVVIITEGSSGISKATALELGEQGASVVIASRSSNAGENVVSDISARGWLRLAFYYLLDKTMSRYKTKVYFSFATASAIGSKVLTNLILTLTAQQFGNFFSLVAVQRTDS